MSDEEWIADYVERTATLIAQADQPGEVKEILTKLIRRAMEHAAEAASYGAVPATIHWLRAGRAACGLPGFPGEWPPGHRWSSTLVEVTCRQCLPL